MQYNWSEINLAFSPKAGQSDEILHVADQTACGIKGGWYYDNPTSPTRIYVCNTTCTYIRDNSKGELNVLYGCPTKNLVP